MSLSLIAALTWMIVANILGILPSKDNHWTRAYWLIAIGLPLLVWVFWENGPWIGLLVLAAGMSVLRWPVRYFILWIRRLFGRAG